MKKGKILLSSILTIALCISLITGATLAMFTDESRVNIAVTSASVSVSATIDEDSLKGYTEYEDTTKAREEVTAKGGSLTFGVTEGEAHFEEAKLIINSFAPGNGVNFDINITNSSTIATKYRVGVMTSSDGADLFAALNFTMKETTGGAEHDLELSSSLGGSRYSAWEDLSIPTTGGEVVSTVNVDLEFDLDCTDETLQGKTCAIDFVVEAVQANAKTDNPVAGRIALYSVNDFIAFSNQVAEGNTFDGQTVTLMNDVDFSGVATAAYNIGKKNEAIVLLDEVAPASYVRNIAATTFSPIGEADHPFKGTFDGNGFAIKNLKASGNRAALFGVTEGAVIQNLVISNANVTADNDAGSAAGVLVAEAKGALTLKDITVIDSTATSEGTENKNVGAVVGMTSSASDGSEAKVTIDSVNVTTDEEEDNFGSDVTNSDLIGGETKPEIEYEGESELDIEIAEGFVKSIVYSEAETTSVYKVLSKVGLASFGKLVNEGTDFAGETITLTCDINLSGENWTPIGNVTHAFKGVFDGQKSDGENYTISNLAINAPDQQYVGLFGNVIGSNLSEKYGVVKNLDLNTVNVVGKAYVGALTGESSGGAIFENINVSHMALSGEKYVAAITGHSISALARKCNVDDFTIDCHTVLLSSGKYDDGHKVGGIMGYTEYYGADQCTVSNGTISGYREIGGIAGYLNHAACDGSSYATNCTVENVHIIVDRTHESEYDGVKNIDALEIVGNHIPCTREKDKHNQSQEGSVAKNVTFEYRGIGLDSVSDDGLTYNITNADEMMAFGAAIAKGAIFAGDTIELKDSITLTEKWTTANNDNYKFKGTFLGNDNSISGLNIDLDADSKYVHAGLFSKTENCVIKDLTLQAPTVKNAYDDCRVGALIGRAYGNATIENVDIVKGSVYSPKTAAGFIAEAKNDSAYPGGAVVKISCCTNSADIRSPKATGFVSQIQFSQIELTDCTNDGNISMPNEGETIANNPDVVMGAFIGYCMGKGDLANGTKDGVKMINCVNNGNIDATINAVVGKLNIGGLISSVHGGKFVLVDCINNGDITVTQNDTVTTRTAEIGGIIGSSGADMYHVEQNGDITVDASKNSVEQFRVGGIVGDEDAGLLHMYGRSAYIDIPKADDGEEKNLMECNIIVKSAATADKQPLVGFATGSAKATNSLTMCEFYAYIEINDQKAYFHDYVPADAVLHGMTGSKDPNTEYSVSDTDLYIASSKDFWDFCYHIGWGPDED